MSFKISRGQRQTFIRDMHRVALREKVEQWTIRREVFGMPVPEFVPSASGLKLNQIWRAVNAEALNRRAAERAAAA